MKKHKPFKKLMALILSVAMVLSMGPVNVFAHNSMLSFDTSSEIIAFKPLEESVANQAVPLGTPLENLALPDTLMVTAEIVQLATPANSTAGSVKDSDEVVQEDATDLADADSDEAAADGGNPATPANADGRRRESNAADDNGSSQVMILVPVDEWVPEPEFDSETIGTYVFTPLLSEAWSLAEAVELPTITVQVIMGIMPLASTANIIDLSDSDTALSAAAAASGGKYSYNSGTKAVTINSGPVTVTGSTTDRHVVVSGTTSVILDNMNIDVSAIGTASAFALQSSANVTITLMGDNVMQSGGGYAALRVPSGAGLLINAPDESQTLQATAHTNGAGIGGEYFYGSAESGTIIIDGGTVVAYGDVGAGIGGGPYGNCGNIMINGGKVIASGHWGAGIGSGYQSGGSNITITGGTVTARCINNTGGAGIGGGGGGSGGNINIIGGTVTATGQGNAKDIGPGENGANGTINITGGSINPTRGNVSPQPTNGSSDVFLNTLTVGNPDIGDGVAISAIDLTIIIF